MGKLCRCLACTKSSIMLVISKQHNDADYVSKNPRRAHWWKEGGRSGGSSGVDCVLWMWKTLGLNPQKRKKRTESSFSQLVDSFSQVWGVAQRNEEAVQEVTGTQQHNLSLKLGGGVCWPFQKFRGPCSSSQSSSLVSPTSPVTKPYCCFFEMIVAILSCYFVSYAGCLTCDPSNLSFSVSHSKDPELGGAGKSLGEDTANNNLVAEAGLEPRGPNCIPDHLSSHTYFLGHCSLPNGSPLTLASPYELSLVWQCLCQKV